MNNRIFVLFLVAFLFVCVSFLVFGGSARKLSAQPQHVRGSANVAVSGYNNSCGNFILWSNGRITSSDGKVVNEADQYIPDQSIKLPSRVKGQCVGASQVAVSVFVGGSGSYVLFADGTVRRPKNSKAAAGNGQFRVVAGNIFKEPAGFLNETPVPQFNSGFTRDLYYNPGTGGSSVRRVRINFDKPFARTPAVFLHELHMASSNTASVSVTLESVSLDNFVVKLAFLGSSKELPIGDKCFFLAIGD
ncbi:MAG: H-type lectin domain-containing protein [Candidatus Bruticola sp.]